MLSRPDFSSREAFLAGLGSIASQLANNCFLRINGACYRVVEFEFYAYADSFQDPHTYGHTLQTRFGQLYLHASGVDITLGDEKNYLGILLRNVVKMYDGAGHETGLLKEQTSGPRKVATELFSNLHPLHSGLSNQIELVDVKGYHKDSCFRRSAHLLATPRVGLTKKTQDATDEFMNLPLRYLAVLDINSTGSFKQQFRDKEKVFDQLVATGHFTSANEQEFLGYQRRKV